MFLYPNPASVAGPKCLVQVHDMGRVAFQDGEEAAWEDLNLIYIPAADAGELPIRISSFVPLSTWYVRQRGGWLCTGPTL